MKKIFSLLFATLLVITLVGCDPSSGPKPKDETNMAILEYPNFPTTPGDKNSWEYIPENTDLTIEWYVDVSSWPIPSDMTLVKDVIKEKTGITINFKTPISDDGQELATMIAGDKIPDILSIPTREVQTITSLAQQGYVYDINTLAERWAPTLLENYPKDIREWWEYGNGKTYGIPNHYYSYDDVPEDEQLQPNGGMMVRKDIFDAWQNHVNSTLKGSDDMVAYTSISGLSKKVPWQGYITTPEGFKAAAKWALENYKSSLTTGLQLSQFTTNGCVSLEWLSQFFAIPYEDSTGKFQYKFTQQAYADMLYYLNDLYNEGIISPANFTQNYDGVGAVIASGNAFATLATPQDYQMHFVTAKDAGRTYVSMYITNEAGDAPVLQDIRGFGYLFNMISEKTPRPDLIIKLFDFLTSKEGQRLVSMGPEGVSWNWTDGVDSEIVYTAEYLADKKITQTAKYGILNFDMLINYQYYDNVQPKVNHAKTEADLFRTNLKRPLSIYAYDCNAAMLVVDATHKDFQKYSNNLTRILTSLGTQIPKIIKAKDRAEAAKIYGETVTTLNNRGLSLVIQLNTEGYEKAKQKLGITYGWAPHQPGYVNPLNRLQPNGDLTKYRSY